MQSTIESSLLASSQGDIYSLVAPSDPSFPYEVATRVTNMNMNTNINANLNANVNANINAGANTNTMTSSSIAKGGVATPFPYKLHIMLEAMEAEAARGDDTGGNSIVCWQPHGKAFKVHKPRRFVEEIMPHFFNQTKYASFQRQLNLYGFSRITNMGPDKGAVHHPCFVRNQRHLVKNMVRRKIKGTKFRRIVAPADQPNFYHHRDEESAKGNLQCVKNNTINISSNNNNNNHKPHPYTDSLRHHHNNDYNHNLQQTPTSTIGMTIANNNCTILQEAVNAVESALLRCNNNNNNNLIRQQAQWQAQLRQLSTSPAASSSYFYEPSSSGW
uniref:HSF-type DNA-binding domain-containing protein n=1 Tax=Pseudo-nitzschia australis TaxID=44445 RepID=A0A7S4AJY1_9STRA